MKALELAKRFFLSRLVIKVLTVTLFFLMALPAMKSVVDGLLKAALVWGGVQILADLLTKRSCLRARHAAWLILVLLCGAVSVLLNYRTGFKENVSTLCYAALGILVLYPNDETRGREALLREMRVIGWVYIGLCAAGAAVSLYMLLANYEAVMEYGGTVYYIGIHGGRLFGVFSNPNLPVCAVASALCPLQFYLCREITRRRGTLPVQYLCLGIGALLNLLFLLLAQSRGSLLAFLTFLGVLLFFLFRKTIFSRIPPLPLPLLPGAALSAVVLPAAVLVYPAFLQTSDRLLTAYYAEQQPPEEASSAVSGVSLRTPAVSGRSHETARPSAAVLDTAPLALRKTAAEDDGASLIVRPDNQTDVTSGRAGLWKVAVERFLEKPVWGWGHAGSLENVSTHGVPIEHYHNLFFHSLVAGGAMGTAALAAALAAMALSMVRFVWKNRRAAGFRNGYIYAGMGLFLLYLVDNMVEVFLLYNVSLPQFVFWIYMGYLLALITAGEPRNRVDRLLCRLADRVPALGRRRRAGVA